MARTVICLRYFLLGYVILLGVSGIIVAVGSGIFIYQLKQYHPLTPENVCGSSITLLVMGIVTCLMGWCGWQIMGFTHRTQILCFAFTLGLMTLIEFGTGIWAIIKHEQIDTLRTSTLNEVFSLSTTEEKSVWDKMQIRLQCCGIDGPADYRTMDSVPWSCCDTTSLENPSTAVAACTTMYARGCLHPVVNRTRSILLHVFLLALCSILVQVCGVISACFFARSIKKNTNRRRREIFTMNEENTQTLPKPSTNIEIDSRLVSKPAVPSRRKS